MDRVRGVFTSEQVMRLTGITKRKLSYWLDAQVVTADIDRAKGRGRVRLYSFQNLVEIRTAMYLREEVSLQILRKVVGRLRDVLDLDHPLAELTLGVLRSGSERRHSYRVIVQSPDGVWEHGEDGQRILTIPLPMQQLTQDLEAAVASDDQARRRPGEVERRRGAMGSAPVLTGTRIPVGAIASLHEAGWSDQRILENYPELTLADIAVAVDADRSPRRTA